MNKNLISILTLTLTMFLNGCALNNEPSLESELISDEPLDTRSKGQMELGAEILSQVPDTYLVNYYKAVINYRSLLKDKNSDQTTLKIAKGNLHKTLSTALTNAQGKKISYDREKGIMLLSKISASVKNQKDEFEIFNKIFELPQTEAAAVLRILMECLQKGF